MRADQNFFRNRSVGLYPKITASPRTSVSENSYWTSYLEAKDLGCSAEAKARETSQIAAQHTQTGLIGVLDRSDRSGWEIQTADWSDRLHRPVSPRQPANKAPNVKSRANELQIQRNLEESFASTP